MTYTQDQFWADHHRGGFRDAVTNALLSLLPETEPAVPEPGNSGTAHQEHKPPKKSK